MPEPFLTAEWRWLVMLNYEVDPAILQSHIPAGTELDQFEGRIFVSVVGFRFLKTRLKGVAIPFHSDFEEINLRFYVRRLAPDGWRRGVVFIKEVVPRSAIAWVARHFYNENYVALPMGHRIEIGRDGTVGRVLYSWTSAERCNQIEFMPDGEARAASPGSLEEFITEHYWGYARQRDGSTVEYQVEHPKWRVWAAREAIFDCDVAGFYGKKFAESLQQPPASAFLADGSTVTVYGGSRLTV